MSDLEKFVRFYDEAIVFISKKYDCTIKHPKDMEDIENKFDGIRINFRKVDCSVFLSNVFMYQLWGVDNRNRNIYRFKDLMEIIDNLILENFRKEYI